MAEDFSDDRRIINEGDDLHFSAAFWAKERIDLVDFSDQRGPPQFGGSRWRDRGGGRGDALRRIGLGLTPPRLVRVAAAITDQMLSPVRNVLCHLGEKVERIEDLEVPGECANGRECAPLWEGNGVVMIGAIENLALRRDSTPSPSGLGRMGNARCTG